MQGWIKLHRQITDNEFYHSERFTKMQAWIDLLLLASHAGNTVYLKGNEIILKEGQLCYSQRELSKRWKWNFRTVKKYLSVLENRGMIHSRKSNVTTVITINNWEKYQFDTPQNTTQNAMRVQHGVQTNKNVKNVNNEKNYNLVGGRYICHTTVFNNSRNFFISYVKSKINPDYVFDAREGKHLKDILKKITSLIKAKKEVFTDDNVEEAFRYIITNITDKWLLERFTLSKINSQFNEVIQGIKKANGTDIDRTFDELAEELQNIQ